MKNYRVTVDGKIFNVVVEEVSESTHLHNMDRSNPERLSKAYPSESEPGMKQQRVSADGAVNVEAPMPGSIINIAVRSGEEVKEGAVLLILEAMKMENEITAPRPGTVGEIFINVGDTVTGGEPLLELS